MRQLRARRTLPGQCIFPRPAPAAQTVWEVSFLFQCLHCTQHFCADLSDGRAGSEVLQAELFQLLEAVILH